MMCDEILNKYYRNATYKYCPDFEVNDSTIQAQLLPGYEYTEWIVSNIFEARPEYQELLAEEGYDVVYHIVDRYENGKEFIGWMSEGQLLDITSDLNLLLRGDETAEKAMSFDSPERVAYGEELYNSYGPDVDPNDLDEYDAECYLAYKRSIGQ